MPETPKLVFLVVSVNVLIWGQSGSGFAQPNGSNPQSAQSPRVVQTSSKAPTTFVLDPIEMSNATYPPAASERKTQGQVVVSILVSETGDVENTQILKGDPLLGAAAQETTKKWKFKPVLMDGSPVAIVSKITFNFVLGDASQIANGIAPEIAPAAEFPRRVRISQGVSTGLLLKKINPVYPKDAKAAHIQGTVLLEAEIGKDGSITDVQPISGHPDLAPAAIEAVRQWRYKPYLFMGRPVAVETQIIINFTLIGS